MSEEPLALITGGTRGVGAAIALALGARGTASILTHRWGGSDEVELRRRFAEVGAPAPEIVEADAGNPEDTERLVAGIAAQKRRVDVFVSNVAVVSRGKGLDDLKLRSLTTSLRYSSWPLSNYLDALERHLGELPRWVIVTSSDGPDHYYPGYDYVATSKAALEALASVLADRTKGTRTRVAILRARQVDTVGYREVFPEAAQELVSRRFARFAVTAEEVGSAVVALVSGLLDGLHGQVLTLDKGAEYMDNMVSAGPVLAEGLR
jgi:NAD(P)-dependent dehydrogenase (short-subunit alcohol dehydrogenase family)